MKITNMNELIRNENLTIRKLEETYYFIIGGEAYEANELGATIVNASGRDLPIVELCNRVSDKYNFDDIDQIKADVEDYVDFLLSEGILINEQ